MTVKPSTEENHARRMGVARVGAEDSPLRALPSIDALLRTETAKSLRPQIGAEHLTALAREVTEGLRHELHTRAQGSPAMAEYSRVALLEEAKRRLVAAHRREVGRGLHRVINATGVILHTNLGRAPLSDAARRAVADEAARYCTLEYDLRTGARGARGARVEELLRDLTGAEAAL